MMRLFQVFGMITMIFVLGTNLVPGAGGKGATIKVRMNDGQEFKGELLTISDRNLVFFPDAEPGPSDPTSITRDVILNIPKYRMDLGGFSLGAFIRIR